MTDDIETPINFIPNLMPEWGSDAIALALQSIGIDYVALTPGASFRGLHDSLVNFTGNKVPKIILCLHEEHAIAIAHGYAKVAKRPMASILHSNVGLMHATMSIYNAFCDRVPIIILGATGPVDSEKRRPWIDWIHTSQDQGALVRNYIKWDNQPYSVNGALEAIYRSNQIAMNAPKGPVYVCLDVSLQESKIKGDLLFQDAERFYNNGYQEPNNRSIIKAVDALNIAKNPLILSGRFSGNQLDWDNRVKLAEEFKALVFTDRKTQSSFPTNHDLYRSLSPQIFTDEQKDIFLNADLILSLDWIDLAGTLRQVWKGTPVSSTIINASVDIYNHNGWSMDHQGLPPVDIHLFSEPDVAISCLLKSVKSTNDKNINSLKKFKEKNISSVYDELSLIDISQLLKDNTKNKEVSFVRLPGGWADEFWDFTRPLSFLGYDGGGGIGSGPGMSIGSSLALRDLYPNILPVAIIGDGDYLMGVNAFWTAVHYKIPLLTIIANNKSYFNDEVHQYNIAKLRGREFRNKSIGQKIVDPDIDLAKLAEAQGAIGFGPIFSRDELSKAISDSIKLVCNGKVCVIDVHIGPRKNISI